jgi:hypothetical protein
MKEQEDPIYLHVNPDCETRQVIHAESILGSNVMILASFFCSENPPPGKVEVEKIEFEIYPMFGIFHWGFKKIIPQPDTDCKKGEVREIKIVLGTTKVDYKMTIYCKDVTWKHDDIIDNKMYFDVLGKEFNRDQLKEIFENGVVPKEEFINIPVEGRPCQFKLVSPMS